MSFETIMHDLQQKKYKPIYWLEGDEDFFIDRVTDYVEKQVLAEGEKDFNLSIFYGRDAEWAEVINICRRYPMFAERQIVMIKEAQGMNNIEKLETYIENPLPSTLLVIAYKHGKIDGRLRLAKLLKEKGEILSAKKLYDNQLPEWIQQYAASRGYTITGKANALLFDHIGNDLSGLSNEIDKLLVNVKDKSQVDENDIEKYVGISKEYNVFELQDAIGKKDMSKAMKIVQYFSSNPKAGPIQVILVSLYNFFSKSLLLFTIKTKNEKEMAGELGVNIYFLKDYIQVANKYGQRGIEKNILLLYQYNLKSVGIDNATTSHTELLKELLYKIMY
jgi:DNA polymerase III subunit delta